MPLASRQTTAATARLLNELRDALLCREPIAAQGSVSRLFQQADLPESLWGCAATLYQPATPRILVVRAGQPTAIENVRAAIKQLMRHGRFDEFAIHEWERCRMQVDFIVDEPKPIALSELSDAVLPDDRVTNEQQVANGVSWAAPWQVQVISTWPEVPMQKLTRFEMGVDGLRIVKEGKRRYFLPGDAFVHSILGIAQLRRHIQRLFPGDDLEQLTYFRFRSLSFVSGVEEDAWIPLYRGLPPVPEVAVKKLGEEPRSSAKSLQSTDIRSEPVPFFHSPEVNDAALLQAARAGTKWIADSLQPDGRFVYYYDAATDTGRDHEHPTRDPETDPYYNLLRHGGGIITLLLDEQLKRKMRGRESRVESLEPELDEQLKEKMLGRDPAYGYDGATDHNQRRDVIERTLDFLVKQLVEYKAANGKEFAYALYNHKAKLGGSGIGLCALAMYQSLFKDDRYAGSAERLANHLIGEINDQGEFRYYHIYLDKPVAWEDNQRYFSFYYPGEAILGLSQYCQHVCRSAGDRREIYAKTHQALRFLLRDRPRLHKEHYQTLPADSWLMMGVNDLWTEPEFQQDEYAQFVFDDADQMVRLMYTGDDALYPDYVGSFYYRYGDHPYPDGARAEGLLAAYQLALKVGTRERIERYRNACCKVAWATLRLCNTADSVYSVPNPSRAIGGIRFKLTRQWFRVDTIQHVASFYLKFVATERHRK